MNTETKSHPPNLLQAFLLVALAIASLVGGAAVALYVDGFACLAVVLAGFGGYLALFAGALRRFGGDWDRWREPDSEWRSGMRRPSGGKRGSGALRLAATTILSAAVALPLVGEEAPTPRPTPAPVAAESAAPAEKPWYQEITVNGFLSVWYEYNTNRPASGRNQYRVFDYLDNSVSVDAAEIVVQKAVEKPGDVGFRVDAVAGNVARVSSAAGLFQGQDFDLQQATVSWIAPVGSGLRLDFGKFITHMGNEVIEGYDGWNDNATRSFVFGYAIPFTHTGLKATTSFGDQLTAMLVLCNGWDVVQDNNSGKSIGAQLIWTPSKAVTVTGNYMGGPEQPNSTANWRNVGNVVAQWKATDRTVFTLELTYGGEPNLLASGETATWSGIVGYARFGLTDCFALNLRGEYFADPDGARTGVPQYLKEVTLTPEWKISRHFLVRGDFRLDWSSRDVFEKKSAFTDSQPTILANAIYVF